MNKIGLSIGSGGRISYDFVNNEIISRFSNEILNVLADGANIENGLVITTDTFTVHPPFFEGGDVGILAFCGMVNDLASMGAEPVYMTMGLVIEEGFPYEGLVRILDGIQKMAVSFGTKLVAGDTKIIEKGKMEGVHINITGIGRRCLPYNLPVANYILGDRIILTGPVGEHTIAVLKAKGAIEFEGEVESDVAPLWPVVKSLLDNGIRPKFMRDVTRGGLGAVLNELAMTGGMKIIINENNIPVNEKVATLCDIYGFDIYSLACEGRMIIVMNPEDAERAINILKGLKVSENSAIIGEISDESRPVVVLNTAYGGKTIMDMPLGEILPRIC